MLFSRFRQLSLLSACLLMCQPGLAAHSPPAIAPERNPLAGRTQSPAGQQDEESIQTFKAQVNVVNLFFNVKDKHGMLIPGLTKDDFEVMEDGKPQTIKYFSAESNQPLTLGILIDTSPSQTRVLAIEQESCAEFLHAFCAPKDLAFLINFDADIDLDQDFTNNVGDLTRALNKTADRRRLGGGPPGLGGGPVTRVPAARCSMTRSTWPPMRS